VFADNILAVINYFIYQFTKINEVVFEIIQNYGNIKEIAKVA